jgi:hypothetical protein
MQLLAIQLLVTWPGQTTAYPLQQGCAAFRYLDAKNSREYCSPVPKNGIKISIFEARPRSLPFFELGSEWSTGYFRLTVPVFSSGKALLPLVSSSA